MGIAHLRYRVQSRCCVLESSRSVPTAARGKTAFDFKLINAKAAAQAAGIRRSAAYFMSDSLTNRAMHKKRSVAYLRVLCGGTAGPHVRWRWSPGLLYLPFAARQR